MIEIREASEQDWDDIWPIFESVVRAGDTYAYPRDSSKDEAFKLWMVAPRQTYIATESGRVLGTYYLKTNQQGPGSHVCNAGYMVCASARGKGVAKKMCLHSQQEAKRMGYKAMQFNFVASSNTVAVHLWTSLGFETVGRLPQAFAHPELGYVDALVMFKWF